MRYWTLEEANAALPRVAALVERARAAQARTHERAVLISRRAPSNGHVSYADPAPAEFTAALEALRDDGVVVRDADSGLVDFAARTSDGRPYWLCWRAGEERVGFWHWPEDGFAGRRPLSEPPT